jgi:protein-disulfide isomerase
MPSAQYLTLFFASSFLLPIAGAADANPRSPAPIKIEVFSDFQCGYCRQFAPAIRELETKGVSGVPTKIVFKHFPLNFHPDAPLAHQAALAAREQGKFWKMHDLLFANQTALKRPNLIAFAQKLGLDMVRFQRDLTSPRIRRIIDADQAEGEKRGVRGTPTFFVNGREYSGTRSFEQLAKLVQEEKARVWALSEITDAMLAKGPADAPVTLEFFADLQSPVSLPALEMLDQLASHYRSAVRVQFRNFPLAFHPHAGMAHAAAMAAARNGRFWEFAGFLLGHQESLREQDLIGYAAKLGIDEAQFAGMVHDRRYAPRVDADREAGLKRGLRGSPVIFVNNRRIDGVPSLQTLTEYVEAELAKKP